MAQYTELLKEVTIFKDLSPVALDALSARLTQKDFAKDSVIVNQEEEGDSLYVVSKGRVKVVLYGESGREIILTIFKTGDFFGEMALLDNQPRSANVIALESSQMLILKREKFVQHLEEQPGTALAILAEMSRRLRRADDIIGSLALLDVYGRVARVLMDMAKKDGEETDEGIMIKERPTQQNIASMVGTSRETVSRALSEFQRRGFLIMRGRTIILSRRAKLEDEYSPK